MNRNTPQLWDQVWKSAPPTEEDIFRLAVAENSLRWQQIEEVVIKEFSSFANVRVIEIGSGAGTHAALMSRRGARVTLLDFSQEALNRARNFFESNSLLAEAFIHQNALSLPASLLEKYDISMSFGLAEHFRGADRTEIIRAHFDLLKTGGLSFILVPNRQNLPFRLYRYFAEAVGRWRFGEEYPFSSSELRDICRQIGIREYSFLDGSLFYSFRIMSQLKIQRKLFGLRQRSDALRIRKERGTFLNRYLSHDLILCAKKPRRLLP